MTNITFSQVQKSFHKKLVLDIPDFQADSGEIFSIVGGNGAGKSTFIKLLAGIFLQDKGEVRVYGVSNRSKKIHSLVKFVLESGQGLYSYLTAMENLQYFLSLNGIALYLASFLNNKLLKNYMLLFIEMFDFSDILKGEINEICL